MTIKEFVEQRKKSIDGVTQQHNPEDDKLFYLSEVDAERLSSIKACKVWYEGDSNKLLAWYQNQQRAGFNANIIYNRNKRNYFWSESSEEGNIKRIHSGIARSIVDTLVTVVGVPQIKEDSGKWEDIAFENDIYTKQQQQASPLTLAMGYGCWKVNIDKEVSNHPIWEFYDAEDVEYTFRSGYITGVLFKTYYKKGDKNYILVETRYKKNKSSYCLYDLFEGNDKDCKPVSLEALEETAYLQDFKIDGLDEILAVPTKYFYDSNDARYGRSIFINKLDLFDFLDEVWSITSEATRSSVPITWVSPDVMDRGANGLPTMPSRWNLKFMQKPSMPDGEGNINDDIQVTQPNVNSSQYIELVNEIKSQIYIGLLSPASLGEDVAKKDNAQAQREKEKITMIIRNKLIDSDTNIWKQIVKLSLILQDYIDTGSIVLKDYDIQVNFNEFATPTFEEMLNVLGTAWSNGEMSTDNYVNKLYPNWSEEDKQKEIEWLDENKKQGSSMDDLMGVENANNGEETGQDVSELGEGETTSKEPKGSNDYNDLQGDIGK